jgi:exopolyphosphatase/guanosine-5'-triphosphate,3'-diphosphate pyrophosphatase
VKRLHAAIDLGTNTVRILVADADPTAGLVPVWADQVVTRLGEGLSERGTLTPSATDGTLTAVRRYRDRARELGATDILLVATAAVRQARDGSEFLRRLQTEPGISPRVVTGEDEARLTLLGAAWGLGSIPGAFALVDIGGGSTEVLVAHGAQVVTAVSLALGVVHLAEQFFVSDPVAAPELTACRAYVDARLRDEAWDRILPHAPTTLVATAGTPTALAVLDLGLSVYDPARVHGHSLSAPAIERMTAWLAALPLAERGRLPGLEPRRADVIVPGAIVLASALAGLSLPAAIVSDAGLREGIILDAVGWRPSPLRD